MLSFATLLATLVISASSAHAEPTVAEIEAQIERVWAELEPMIEQHNAIRIELAEKKQQAAVLALKIAPLQRKLDLARAQLTDLAVYTYKGGNASAFNAMLTTGSLTTVADQLALLEQFNRAQQSQLQAVVDAKEEYEAKKAPLDELVEELTEIEQQLQQRAEEIDAEVKRLQSLRLRAYGDSAPVDELRPAPCPDTYVGGPIGKVLTFACDQIGKQYQWGAAGKNTFDASGLTKMAWAQAGVNLPHNAAAQRRVVPYVDRSELQPGDLVFYSGLSHIGIYVGGGWIVHAPQAGQPVRMRAIDAGQIHSYGRPGR